MKTHGVVVVLVFASVFSSAVLKAQGGTGLAGFDLSGSPGMTGLWDASAMSPVTQVVNLVSGGPALAFASGSSSPTVVSNWRNGNDALLFDGTDDYATISGNILNLVSSNMGSIWVVFELNSIGTNASPINHNDALITGGYAGIFVSDDDGSASIHAYNHCGLAHVFLTSALSNPTDPHFFAWEHLSGYLGNSLDGTSSAPVEAYPTASNPPSPVNVGRNTAPDPDEYFHGYISEILTTDVSLGQAQMDLLVNYFSARHDIPIPSYCDFYAGDETVNGDYDWHVSGIGLYGEAVIEGRSDGLVLTDQQTEQSFLQDDGDYALGGYSLAATGAVTVTSTNAHYRWARTWFIDVTDVPAGEGGTTGGDVDVSFDFSEGGLPITPSGTYYLLRSTDGGTTWTEHATTTSITGDEVNFPDVDVLTLDGYVITIGAATAEALPVELTIFEAIPEINSVRLEWRTATEANNYGFEVERALGDRSGNGGSWSTVGFVQGNGTKQSSTVYTYRDVPPGPGTYCYRLKQVDLDGAEQYSSVVTVTLGPVPAEFCLEQNYPNPCNPSTTIRFGLPDAARARVAVYNTLGEKVATLVDREMKPGYHEVKFDASGLPSGLYVVRLESGGTSAARKIVVAK